MCVSRNRSRFASRLPRHGKPSRIPHFPGYTVPKTIPSRKFYWIPSITSVGVIPDAVQRETVRRLSSSRSLITGMFPLCSCILAIGRIDRGRRWREIRCSFRRA